MLASAAVMAEGAMQNFVRQNRFEFPCTQGFDERRVAYDPSSISGQAVGKEPLPPWRRACSLLIARRFKSEGSINIIAERSGGCLAN